MVMLVTAERVESYRLSFIEPIHVRYQLISPGERERIEDPGRNEREEREAGERGERGWRERRENCRHIAKSTI